MTRVEYVYMYTVIIVEIGGYHMINSGLFSPRTASFRSAVPPPSQLPLTLVDFLRIFARTAGFFSSMFSCLFVFSNVFLFACFVVVFAPVGSLTFVHKQAPSPPKNKQRNKQKTTSRTSLSVTNVFKVQQAVSDL